MEIWDISPNCKNPHCRYLLWASHATLFIVNRRNLAISFRWDRSHPLSASFSLLTLKAIYTTSSDGGVCSIDTCIWSTESFSWCWACKETIKCIFWKASLNMHPLLLLCIPGLDQSWVLASEFEAKLKIAVNGKGSQTRVCSTRRNRARMENLEDWA